MLAASLLLEKIASAGHAPDVYRTSSAVSLSVERFNVFVRSDAIALLDSDDPLSDNQCPWFVGSDRVLAAATHLLRVTQK